MLPTTRPRAPVLDTVSWVWVVVQATSASGSQAVEAVFAVERAAREYIASQGRDHDLLVQAHRLHQDAPAPLYGLLARSARVIAELDDRWGADADAGPRPECESADSNRARISVELLAQESRPRRPRPGLTAAGDGED